MKYACARLNGATNARFRILKAITPQWRIFELHPPRPGSPQCVARAFLTLRPGLNTRFRRVFRDIRIFFAKYPLDGLARQE